ncbi:MAG TPA: hypothetical protein IAB18_10300 [Candidatus Avisuccinivibrio pullicola]|nr:hypothetical protein [Candidatus Avisuccinivibrio pullicola]
MPVISAVLQEQSAGYGTLFQYLALYVENGVRKAWKPCTAETGGKFTASSSHSDDGGAS